MHYIKYVRLYLDLTFGATRPCSICLTSVSAPYHAQAWHTLFALARLEEVGFGTVRAQARSADNTVCGGFTFSSGRQQHTKSGLRAVEKSATVFWLLMPANNWTMSLQDEKEWRISIWKYGSCSIDQVAQACSGTVRLEQFECRPAGERGGGTAVLQHGTR